MVLSNELLNQKYYDLPDQLDACESTVHFKYIASCS